MKFSKIGKHTIRCVISEQEIQDLGYTIEEIMSNGERTQGIEQGVAQGIENTARRMLASTKYSDAEISEITGLSMAQIQTLKESL